MSRPCAPKMRLDTASGHHTSSSHLVHLYGNPPNKNAALLNQNECRARAPRKRASAPLRDIMSYHPNVHPYARTTPQYKSLTYSYTRASFQNILLYPIVRAHSPDKLAQLASEKTTGAMIFLPRFSAPEHPSRTSFSQPIVRTLSPDKMAQLVNEKTTDAMIFHPRFFFRT